MDNNKINKEVEKTLNSLEGIKKAEVKPFFYTRLSARLNDEKEIGPGFKWQWAMAMVIFIMLLNGFAYLNLWSEEVEEQEIELLADEYAIDYSDVYSQELEP